jgi:protein-L-isoaspartate(D-aspartate) O-methyltransferase
MALTQELAKQRRNVVTSLERLGYLPDPKVKRAMLKVKREDFVPEENIASAYIDMPLSIPGGGTISAPHMHAISLCALKLKPGEKFLEVGAGSGIILAYAKEIVGMEGKVFGIEINKESYKFAKENLKRAGYEKKVKMIHEDGSQGLPEEAPFDKVLISAASPQLPEPIKEQVKVGGVVVAVVGPPYGEQELVYFEKTKDGSWKSKNLGGVIFVPLLGKFGWK